MSASVHTSSTSEVKATAGPQRLARLPVPDLHTTLQNYVQSLIPFLREHEARDGTSFDAAVRRRLDWATSFEEGVGSQCQSRLIELDRQSPRNWLDDNIWLKKAYHEWRAPLLINSNWWLAFHNDESIPRDVVEGRNDDNLSGIDFWQVRRAAWMIYRILEFKDKLDQQELYPSTTKTGLWFRDAVERIFYTCRIPQRDCDMLSPQPSHTLLNARRIVVMLHDWMYAVEVYLPNGSLAHPSEIERRLLGAVVDAHSRKVQGEHATPIGILTSDDRNKWALSYEHLKSLSPNNSRILEAIHQSVFAVSLDAHTYGQGSARVDSSIEVNQHLHNIRSSADGRNRWFDKAITLIVESNTRAGAMGEHSPCDALVPSIVMDYAVVQSIDEDAFEPIESVIARSRSDLDAAAHWTRLDFDIDDRLRATCEEALVQAKEIIADSDDAVHWFNDFGSDWIKNEARLSPDAFVQMALQLAWYKARGAFTAVYETVLTRLFDRGRTETIRSHTDDSRTWVLAMVDPASLVKERHVLLQRAIQTHTKLTREAATGKGIDRHLLGLQLMLRDGERSEIFEDPLYKESQTWKLSTSGLSAGHLFRGTGFGAPYADGYGINYLIAPSMIKFGVESKVSSPLTSTARFHEILAETLLEMKTLCLEASRTSAHL